MINEHTAAVLLAKWFMKHIRQFEEDAQGKLQASPSYKHSIIEDAYNVLGVLDFFEVRDKLQNYTGEKIGVYNLSKHLDVEVKDRREKNELIQLGTFYMHPVLQVGPKPRKVYIDYRTMEETREEPEPFFLEIKESFTVEDVLAYYYKKHLMDPIPGNAHLTQFMNLTQSYSLDLVLYLIDASAITMLETDEMHFARVPAFLPNYIEEAKQLIERRKNKLTEGGLMHIVPREIYFR